MKAVLRPTARRLLVAKLMERDNWQCVRCGQRATDPHHRVNQGMGGSANPAIHFITNLLAACRICNEWFEDYPISAKEAGWKVSHGTDPGSVSVLYPDGLRWLLTADGGRRVVAHAESDFVISATPESTSRYHGPTTEGAA